MGVYVVDPFSPCLSQVAAWKDYCLPDFVPCNTNPTDGPIKECDLTWNLYHCAQDSDFAMMFKHGDLLQFQVRFVDFDNDDPENPETGWNEWVFAKLFNQDGELVSEDVTEFCSRYIVGHDGSGSYQVIEIDTGLSIFDDIDCWYLEFETRRTGEDEEVEIVDSACSEPWCDCDECTTWPLVHGLVSNRDGHGYWHGYPNGAWAGSEKFAFDPAYRFPIQVFQVGAESTKVVSADDVVSLSTRLVFRLEVIEIVPPYVLNMLILGQLVGKYVDIADIRYVVDGLSVSKSNRGREMMVFNLNLYQDGQSNSPNCE